MKQNHLLKNGNEITIVRLTVDQLDEILLTSAKSD